jgi:hypothetical protein
VEWLKVKALSSSPSTTKKRKKERNKKEFEFKLHGPGGGSYTGGAEVEGSLEPRRLGLAWFMLPSVQVHRKTPIS